MAAFMAMSETAQAIVGALLIGVVGFAISAGWGRISGRGMDRDTYLFLGYMWAGLTLFGILLHFVM